MDLRLLVLIATLLIAALISFIIFSLKTKHECKGYLYVNEGDNPHSIFLQLTISLEELEKLNSVNLKVEKINSHKEHTL